MARILVVDDEEPIRALLKRLLALHGHAVDTAENGAQAVDLVQAKAYDLMIIDSRMPKMSGIDAVAILRTSPRFKDLKILMATQDGVSGNVDKAFEAGVDGYVLKPFDMPKLLAKIERTLAA